MRGTPDLPRKAQVPALSSASSGGDNPLDLVPSIGESPLEPLDEGAEVRIPGPRVHLRNEEDLHAR
jgi:hypothetical protein